MDKLNDALEAMYRIYKYHEHMDAARRVYLGENFKEPAITKDSKQVYEFLSSLSWAQRVVHQVEKEV